MNKLTQVRRENDVTYWRFVDTGQDLARAPPPKAERLKVHTLLISDTHLGMPSCRARALLAALNTFWIEHYLILNGDIFQDLNFKRISGAQWKVLSRIRKLTDPDIPLEEVWVRGNHDDAIANVMSHLVWIPVVEEFVFTCGTKRYLAIHGDQFDHIILRFRGIAKILTWIFEMLSKLDPYHRNLTRWISKKTGEWSREHERVARGALDYASIHKVDVVICGHTHLAMRQKSSPLGIEYINSGCWVTDTCSFVTITEDGPMLNMVELS